MSSSDISIYRTYTGRYNGKIQYLPVHVLSIDTPEYDVSTGGDT
jgi:hypothetical protein